MLDLRSIKEDPSRIKKDLEKRFQNDKIKWVDEILSLDKEFKNLKKQAEDLRHRRNNLSHEINNAKKEKRDINPILEEAKVIPIKIKQIEEKQEDISKKLDFYLMRLPNYLGPLVPVGKDETESKTIRKFGVIPRFKFKLKGHEELGLSLGLLDIERAAKISGARFYFLKGDLALLELAIMRCAIDFITKKGYELIIPPFMMRRSPYEGVVDLTDFEEVLYKIENEDLYMIATSEHPLTARFNDEVIDLKDLPIKNVGFSTNFRKEAGAHGKDTKGIFRVHQFNKVEQVIICSPKDSWKYHEELIKNIEGFFKLLKIPFRIVDICTGDLGSVAAKKYDLESWMPVQSQYREMGSCSNCTDYQARRLNIKYLGKNNEREVVHTLNSTLVTDRALVAILENYQQKDGSIKIPTILQKYMNGKKKITLNKLS